MLENGKQLITQVANGDIKALARVLSIVENDLLGADEILKSLIVKEIPVLGITGPPGAGKSTLVNALINQFLAQEKKVAVLAIDPTSPFNLGSLLGDRIRMKDHFNNPEVYIRSIATRGSLGGISAKTIEMVDVLKSADFDLIIIETVGVGQSEVEIAGLADTTVVVLVPEAGDEIQHIKSGLMEVADIFVVNKADRAGADLFANTLQKLLKNNHQEIKVFKTIAENNTGIQELSQAILSQPYRENNKRLFLLTEKAWKLIQHRKMKSLNKETLQKEIAEALPTHFNMYQFIEKFRNS